jgi:16S rRNA (guanine527-N7)-methyltransferase
MNNIKQIFDEKISEYDIKITDNQKNLFIKYYDILVDYQKQYSINLTKIIEPEEFVIKNFIDVIFLNNVLTQLKFKIKKCVDLGTGNGVPGILLAILNPDIEFLLVDSTLKKLKFIDFCSEKIKLFNCKTCHSRIEELPLKKKYFRKFDITVARALSQLNQLIELAAPFLKVNGFLLAQKSIKIFDELELSKKIMDICFFELIENHKFEIQGLTRYITVFQKKQNTPKQFPRKTGVYKKKPII